LLRAGYTLYSVGVKGKAGSDMLIALNDSWLFSKRMLVRFLDKLVHLWGLAHKCI